MRIVPLVLVLLLTGCASKLEQGAQNNGSWKEHRNRISTLEQWSLEGKTGARQGDASTSFNMVWTQQGSAFEIHLFGPLGQGSVSISGDDTFATLTQGSEQITASNLQTLVAENHSIQLPLDALTYWIRGIPDPSQPAQIALGSQGLLAHMLQLDWDIVYTDYGQTDPPLPRKFTISRADTSAKIIIKSWDLSTLP